MAPQDEVKTNLAQVIWVWFIRLSELSYKIILSEIKQITCTYALQLTVAYFNQTIRHESVIHSKRKYSDIPFRTHCKTDLDAKYMYSEL